MEESKEKTITIRMTEELMEHGREVGGKRYRTKSLSQTVRLLIEDAWKEEEGIANQRG